MYHSFGTYILTQYLKHFAKERVVGLIDIGGAPVSFYEYLRLAHFKYLPMSIEQIEK